VEREYSNDLDGRLQSISINAEVYNKLNVADYKGTKNTLTCLNEFKTGGLLIGFRFAET